MFKDWAGCGVYGRFRLDGFAAVAAGLLQVPLSLQPPHCVAVAGSAALRIPNVVRVRLWKLFTCALPNAMRSLTRVIYYF